MRKPRAEEPRFFLHVLAPRPDGGHGALLTPLAQLRTPLTHTIDVAADLLNPLTNPPAIGLELRLTRAARADSTAEARQRAAGFGAQLP